MSGWPDWWAWILLALVVALFAWFFWDTARVMVRLGRRLVSAIQDWPETRRAMVEAEAQSGGRYPLWFRAARVCLILALVGLVVLVVWRKFASL